MDETTAPATPAEPIATAPKDQRLSVSIAAGLVAAIIGAILWAAITVSTEYQIGFMAIGVGFLVGFAVRMGNGSGKVFGIIGAVFALLGCLLGNCLTIIAVAAKQQNLSYLDAFRAVDFSGLMNAMVSTMQPMDFVFYAIAVYEGYRFSMRQPVPRA